MTQCPPSAITTDLAQVKIAAPGDLIELIARRVAEIVVARIGVREDFDSPWMGVRKAAEYLDMTEYALYKLTAGRAIPFRKKVNGQGLLFHRDELDARAETQYPRLDRLG